MIKKVISKITLEIEPASEIIDVCTRAQRLADQEHSIVLFTFNEILLVAQPGGSSAFLCGEYYIRKGDNA